MRTKYKIKKIKRLVVIILREWVNETLKILKIFKFK